MSLHSNRRRAGRPGFDSRCGQYQTGAGAHIASWRLEEKVFAAVTMKNAVFWDVVPCGFIINRRLGGTCCLHLQGKRNNARREKVFKAVIMNDAAFLDIAACGFYKKTFRKVSSPSS
jgi:hypothetical protein